MFEDSSATKLAQPFWPVKSTVNTLLTPPFNSMMHHKAPLPRREKTLVSYNNLSGGPYGVSRTRRVLSPQLLLKKHNYVLSCLRDVLGMTAKQRSVTFELLRLWAYYGRVYPKEAHITEGSWSSKATFWRTIKLLEELGLIQVVNRYVVRPHAQISNLYRLDQLVLLLARYLAEHGVGFLEKWLTPILTMPGRVFWRAIFQSPGDRVSPMPLELSARR